MDFAFFIWSIVSNSLLYLVSNLWSALIFSYYSNYSRPYSISSSLGWMPFFSCSFLYSSISLSYSYCFFRFFSRSFSILAWVSRFQWSPFFFNSSLYLTSIILIIAVLSCWSWGWPGWTWHWRWWSFSSWQFQKVTRSLTRTVDSLTDRGNFPDKLASRKIYFRIQVQYCNLLHYTWSLHIQTGWCILNYMTYEFLGGH